MEDQNRAGRKMAVRKPGILVREPRLISENPRNLRFRLFSIRPPTLAKRSAERVCFQIGSLRHHEAIARFVEFCPSAFPRRPWCG